MRPQLFRTRITELELAKPALYYTKSDLTAGQADLLQRLAGLGSVEQVTEGKGLALMSSQNSAWLGVDEPSLQNYKIKLTNRQQSIQKRLDSLQKQLDNKDFTKNAPKEVLEARRQSRRQAQADLQILSQQLKQLGGTA